MNIGSRTWRWLGSWILATAALYWSIHSVDWRAVSSSVSHARLGWLGLAIVANSFILICWTGVWHTFLPARASAVEGGPPHSRRKTLRVVMLTAIAMNTAPWLVGQASGVFLLSRMPGVTAGEAMGVVAAETVAETIAKVGIIALAIVVAPISPLLRMEAFISCAIGFAVAITIAAIARSRHRMVAGFAALRSTRVFAPGMLFLFGSKLAEAAGIVCVQHAFHVALPWTSIVLVLAAIQVATLISLTPANAGTYEGAVVAVYLQFGLSPDVAFSIAIMQHMVLLLPLVLPGYAVLVLNSIPPQSRVARALQALSVWLHLVLFGSLLGCLAIARGLNRRSEGSHWRGMRGD